jgi:hypothetical protein
LLKLAGKGIDAIVEQQSLAIAAAR